MASGTPPHPALAARGGDRVRFLGAVDAPAPYYASAVATLVPAFEVRGVKTTILQGWAAGCPVVAAAPSAASVGGVDGHDLLIGRTAGELVTALQRVAADPVLRERLARNGAASYAARFSAGAVAAALARAPDHLATGRGVQRAGGRP
ncbi:MAG: glycosyltransferase [Thermoleophilia bacterium]